VADIDKLITITKKATLIAGETKIVDKIPLTKFKAVDYLIALESNSLSKVFKIYVRKKGSTVSDQLFAKNGDAIDIEANPIVNGSDFELQIINNEINGLNLSFVRTLII